MHLPSFNSQNQVIVCFINMKDSEPMNLWKSSVFLQHGVDYVLPFIEGIAKLCGIIEEKEVAIKNLVSILRLPVLELWRCPQVVCALPNKLSDGLSAY